MRTEFISGDLLVHCMPTSKPGYGRITITDMETGASMLDDITYGDLYECCCLDSRSLSSLFLSEFGNMVDDDGNHGQLARKIKARMDDLDYVFRLIFRG